MSCITQDKPTPLPVKYVVCKTPEGTTPLVCMTPEHAANHKANRDARKAWIDDTFASCKEQPEE